MAFDKSYYSTGSYSDYHTLAIHQSQMVYQQISQAVQIDSQWKFFDVGCGYGHQIAVLRSHGLDTWGIEVSDFCLKESPYRQWMMSAPATKIPFPDLSFDVAISFSVLYYLSPSEIKTALSEIARVTKVGLYLDCITLDSPNSDQQTNPDDMRQQDNLLLAADWETLLRQAGFSRSPQSRPQSGNPDFHGFFLKKSM